MTIARPSKSTAKVEAVLNMQGGLMEVRRVTAFALAAALAERENGAVLWLTP